MADPLKVTVNGVTQLLVDTAGMQSTVPLLLPRDPTKPLEAATKQYVDAHGGGGGGGGNSASDITLVPGGDVSSDNVQDAIIELDSDKVAIAGDTMTGLLILSGDPTNLLGAATKQYVDTHSGASDWDDIVGKPPTFPPSPHNHTIPEVTGLQPALDLKADKSYVDTQDATKADKTYVDAQDALKEDKANKGVANGYAPLDAGGKVPAAQLPAFVDDVLEFANLAAFPATGTVGVIYVALDTNKVYRWSGSTYIEISPSPGSTDAVPEGSINLYFTTARASAAAPVQSVAGRTGAVTLTKADVGLDQVDNTSDASKPVSTATQTALNGKEATITAGTTAQYWRGDKSWQTLDKAAVGLGNVDNTSDASKPVSTATQAALNLKADLASPTLTGDPKAPTPAPGDNDTSIATTAYVMAAVTAAGGAAPGNANPIMDGTAVPGVSALYSRQDHVHPSDTSRVAKTGDTMTGLLTLAGAPTNPLHAATMQYVDLADANKANITYVDAQDNLRVLKAGDTMTGDLAISKLAPALQLKKTGGAGSFNSIEGYTGSSIRWRMLLGNVTAESGSNAGSDFYIINYTDAGAEASPGAYPFVINRASGDVNLGKSLTVRGGTLHLYGFGGDNNQGVIRLNSAGDRYLYWNGSSYTLNGAVVSASNGRLWGATDGTPIWNSVSNAVSNVTDFSGNHTNWTLSAHQANAGGSGFYTQIATDTNMSIAVLNSAGNSWAHAFFGNGSYACTANITAGTITSNAWLQSKSGQLFLDADGTPSVQFRNAAGAVSTQIYCNISNGMLVLGWGTPLQVDSAGTIYGGLGYKSRAGAGGAYGGNVWNYHWTGAMQCWVDYTNNGNVTLTSDYRTKKDVVDLPGMWETVKTLRPIKYTQRTFDPPSAAKATEENPDRGPMFVEDDIERWGFVAHELQEKLVATAATGVKDSPDHVQSLNLAPVVAALTKALQEAMERIEGMERMLRVVR